MVNFYLSAPFSLEFLSRPSKSTQLSTFSADVEYQSLTVPPLARLALFLRLEESYGRLESAGGTYGMGSTQSKKNYSPGRNWGVAAKGDNSRREQFVRGISIGIAGRVFPFEREMNSFG